MGTPLADVVCEHGTAMDVHCCNCHSGFLFDRDSCVCRFDGEGIAAIDVIEAMPADLCLTDAVVLLGEAKESVADFIDAVQRRRFVRVEDTQVDKAPA